jgi:hypothetical protein
MRKDLFELFTSFIFFVIVIWRCVSFCWRQQWLNKVKKCMSSVRGNQSCTMTKLNTIPIYNALSSFVNPHWNFIASSLKSLCCAQHTTYHTKPHSTPSQSCQGTGEKLYQQLIISHFWLLKPHFMQSKHPAFSVNKSMNTIHRFNNNYTKLSLPKLVSDPTAIVPASTSKMSLKKHSIKKDEVPVFLQKVRCVFILVFCGSPLWCLCWPRQSHPHATAAGWWWQHSDLIDALDCFRFTTSSNHSS